MVGRRCLGWHEGAHVHRTQVNLTAAHLTWHYRVKLQISLALGMLMLSFHAGERNLYPEQAAPSRPGPAHLRRLDDFDPQASVNQAEHVDVSSGPSSNHDDNEDLSGEEIACSDCIDPLVLAWHEKDCRGWPCAWPVKPTSEPPC